MIIFRYLFRQVFSTMLAVTLILLLVFMSGRFIKYLAQAAAGGLSPDVLFNIMAFRLPGFLELILPLGFFIGVLLAYGRMYLESEMTVLHACGYSEGRLYRDTLLMSFLVAAVVGGMSLWASPAGMQQVERIFEEQSKLTEFEMLLPGNFQKLKSGNRVTYTQALSDDKRTMFNVFISEPSRQTEGASLIYAREGYQQINAETGERFLVLRSGRRYEGRPGAADFQVLEFETYGIRIDQPDAEKRSVKEEAIPSNELLGSDDSELRALLHWRLGLPALVPVVTLLALSLCRVNPRQGRFFHLFPAMIIYVAYLGLLIVARKSVAKQEVSEFALWGVHAVFLAISLGLLSRSLWWPRLMSVFRRAHASD